MSIELKNRTISSYIKMLILATTEDGDTHFLIGSNIGRPTVYKKPQHRQGIDTITLTPLEDREAVAELEKKLKKQLKWIEHCQAVIEEGQNLTKPEGYSSTYGWFEFLKSEEGSKYIKFQLFCKVITEEDGIIE